MTIKVVDGAESGLWQAGTVINSMRERAALVGGTLALGNRTVLANLPL